MKAKPRKNTAIIRAMKHGAHKAARKFVAQRLKELREKRDLTQDELAALAKIHRSYIGVVERADKGVGIDTLGRICDALGITVQDFFSGK